MAATGGGEPLADGLSEPTKKRKVDTSEEKQQGAVGSAAPSGTPPLPLGKRKELAKWVRERRWITRPAAKSKDPRASLPTVVKPEDPGTVNSVESPHDKALVREAGRSVVGVSSFELDGSVIEQCSGIVLSWKVTSKCARILTSSTVMGYDDDPKIKLHVLLPNKAVIEGQLLFFNKHYGFALLEISSDSDLPLQVPSFGSSPNYGQEVFLLARGAEKCNLMARHGRIKWSPADPKHWSQNHLMLLTCDFPMYGTGGPAIDHDGHVVGMSSFGACTFLGISTILTCIEMWTKFGRIARPHHGLSLTTVELLDVSLQERIFLDHDISSGYIVKRVSANSTAENLGMRYGDVIVSFDGLRHHTLPQLEDYLLSLGWDFLNRSSIESSSNIVELKLEVYDPLGCAKRSITLPVELSDG